MLFKEDTYENINQLNCEIANHHNIENSRSQQISYTNLKRERQTGLYIRRSAVVRFMIIWTRNCARDIWKIAIRLFIRADYEIPADAAEECDIQKCTISRQVNRTGAE